jgi:hypothetical protein
MEDDFQPSYPHSDETVTLRCHVERSETSLILLKHATVDDPGFFAALRMT